MSPRSWWWPLSVAKSGTGEPEVKQHEQCSKTINRVFLSLVAYSSFCLFTLGVSDESLIGGRSEIQVPFAGVRMTFDNFLIIGPLILVAIASYLHIFVGEWLTYSSIPRAERSPHIFNFDGISAHLLSLLVFYALSPLVLFWFFWKARAHPQRHLVFWLAMGFTIILVWLYIRRCPQETRARNNLVAWLLLSACVIYSLRVSTHGLVSRPLFLPDAALQGRDLAFSDLSNADLRRANLAGAKLSQANLVGANLTEANLTGAIMDRTNLQDSMLIRATLNRANLSGAMLAGAELTDAKLIGAFAGTIDLGAVKGLSQDQLDKACFHRATRLPSGLRIPTTVNPECPDTTPPMKPSGLRTH